MPDNITIGQRFGKLVVIAESDKKQRIDLSALDVNEKDIQQVNIYPCRCACGAECEVREDLLLKGLITSCGCDRPLDDILEGFRQLFNTHNVNYREDYKMSPTINSFHFAIFNYNNELLGVIDFLSHGYYTRIGNEKKERVRKRKNIINNKTDYCTTNNIKYLILNTQPLIYENWFNNNLTIRQLISDDPNIHDNWNNPAASWENILNTTWAIIKDRIERSFNINDSNDWCN